MGSGRCVEEPFEGAGGWFITEELQKLKEDNQKLVAENAELEAKYQQLAQEIKEKEASNALLPPALSKALQEAYEQKIIAAKKLAEISKTIKEKERQNAERLVNSAILRRKISKGLVAAAESFKLIKTKLNSEVKQHQDEYKKYQSQMTNLIALSNPRDRKADKQVVNQKTEATQQDWKQELSRHKEVLIPIEEESSKWCAQTGSDLHCSLTWLKLRNSTIKTAKELAVLTEEKSKLENELGIPLSAKNTLPAFGGLHPVGSLRYLRYGLSAKEIKELDKNFLAAVEACDTWAAQKWFGRGANVNMLDPDTGFTLLLSVLMRAPCSHFEGCVPMVTWLIEHEADPNQKTTTDYKKKDTHLLPAGSTPMILLANIYKLTRGVAKACDLLLKYGALIDVQNSAGKTALHLSAEYSNNEESMKYLLTNKARFDITDVDGETALGCYEKHSKLECAGEIYRMIKSRSKAQP